MAGATLLVEYHKSSFDARGEPYRSELAITLAASLANALYHLGQPFGLVTNARDAADRLREEGWQVPTSGGVYQSRGAAEAAVAEAEHDTRLAPLVVPLKKDEEQLQTLRETLARMELNDGLTFGELLGEAGSQLSRQATVVAILPGASPETVLALSSLKQRGYAVTAILLIVDEVQHSDHYARLMAEGIEARSLMDEAGISTLCQGLVGR